MAAGGVSPAARRRQWLGAGAGLVVLALALLAMHRELRSAKLGEIAAAFGALDPVALAGAAALTATSYLLLSFSDGLALRYTAVSLPWPRSMSVACLANSIANAVGFGPLSASAVRLRLYGLWDVPTPAVATVALITTVLGQLGAVIAGAIGLLFGASALAERFGGASAAWTAGGALLLLPVAGLAFAAARLREPVTWREVQIAPPGARVVLAQMLSCGLDWIATAAVLWVMLPAAARPDLLPFLPVFGFAGLFGALSGLPGGLGAFDAVIILFAPPGAEPAYAAALLGYRVIYFAGPLLVAGVAGAWNARRSVPRLAASAHRLYGGVAQVLAPGVFALLVFLAGLMMLLSAATPSLPGRLRVLNDWLPLGVIEASHFFASVLGIVLLLVAGGLYRRLHRAWLLALVLCALAAVATLLKGFDWEESLVLLALCLPLALARPAFYRRAGSLLSVTPAWLMAALGALGIAVWALLVAFRNQPYADELWWTFLRDGDISRSLRGAVGSTIVMIVFLVWRWLGGAERQSAGRPLREVRADVERILVEAPAMRSDAHLALLGDKLLILSPTRRSFLQYGEQGRNWVMMGEPAGAPEEFRALLWEFKEAADRAGARPILYSVRASMLPDLVELGFAVQKIGETALVPLEQFTLSGHAAAPLRTARNRLQRAGASFEVVPREKVRALLPLLQRLSDQWLAHHGGVEKGFSLGSFDADYLTCFPLALVRLGGEPVAFANLWTTPDRSELSIDLMRHGDNAPNGVMDYLFIEIALWGQAGGYRVFDLGMAPLSGIEAHPLAPLWTRLAGFVYQHGERFYGFEGLRRYKSKFAPHWEPLYIAAPSRLMLPTAIGDVAVLTSGGLLGMIGRGGGGGRATHQDGARAHGATGPASPPG